MQADVPLTASAILAEAVALMSIYAHFESQSGTILTARMLLAVGNRRRISPDALQRGLNYSRMIGWIEMHSSGGLKLTPSGFYVMKRFL
ncbi:MAG: hypothetical protein EOP83_09970 [Verrucomicrobiaceae bacterium]|nr:MAG: hypothetical protein EOP83_09970 [Verrucomicrobiaceae bacterium]